jgi:hypothetical protein
MKSNLAGLYIQIEAKKRRITENVVNIVPKWAIRLALRTEGPMESSAAVVEPAKYRGPSLGVLGFAENSTASG